MNVDILYLYEHKNRELEAASLLTQALTKRGFSVELRQIAWRADAAFSTVKPRLIITPWCYDNSDVQMLTCFKPQKNAHGYKIVDLHSEQISNPGSIAFLLPTGRAMGTIHFCWGEYFKNQLLNCGVDSDHIHVTGSQRLDLFNPRYKALSCSKQELSKAYGLDPDKHWIILIGGGNPAVDFRKREAYNKDAPLESDDFSAEDYREDIRVWISCYDKLIEWYDELAKALANEPFEIIYRPHPSEAMSNALQMVVDEHSNLHVIGDRAIRDWFLNCSVAFSFNSTSSVEAAAAKVPVFLMRPEELPASMEMELIDLLYKVRTPEELADVARDSVGTNPQHKTSASFLENVNYYYSSTGVPVVDRCADCIEEAFSNDSDIGFFESSPSSAYNAGRVLRYAGKQALFHTGLLKRFEWTETIANDHTTKREQIEMMSKMAALL